ncbi:hypothetical protein CYLTODRAFT_328632, partial [Cylindrobasidium torrendii FP15055 ss-10]
LKPDPPEEYSGHANVREFVTFMEDASDYVREGGVERKYRVRKVSRYLTGGAKEWYISRVQDRVKEWSLRQFFTALYNHCFPVTFRSEQREKLSRAYQGNQSVRQHAMRLEELFNSIGISESKDRALKLWESLNTDIQQGLWNKDLAPETATYDEI